MIEKSKTVSLCHNLLA